jgi:hypothetical protein
MRKVLCLAVLITAILQTPVMSAQFSSITDNGSVGKFEKFEATYNLGQTYKNPFDPAQIDVTAVFTSPSGLTHQVKGFIYQDFIRTGDSQSEVLTPSGPPIWKVRFSPDETGTWSYSLQATDASGTARVPARSFTVTSSTNKGFVRVSSKDPDYFAFDNGQPYFPLGENMGWGGKGRTFDYDKWLTALSAAGGNYIRLWQAPWSTEIEWAYSYDANTRLPGDYTDRLKEAWELDYILDLCAQKKVYALLCLINHGKFSSTTNPNWDSNPYNKKANPKGGFLDMPDQVWTSPIAKAYLQRNWRYLIARYAHYTSLESWEIFNEMEWTDHYSDHVADSVTFHRQTGDYLKANDPYKHLVTSSYANALKWPTGVWDSGMQFTQEHNYGGLDMAQVVDSITSQMRARNPGKPFYVGEMGIGGAGGAENQKDPTGIFIHNTNWGSLTAKAAGGGFPWWWDNYVDPNNLYWRWTGIAGFVAGEDMDAHNYQPVAFQVVTPGLSDLTFSPGNNGWGVKAPENHFTLTPDGGVVPAESNLTGFVYSTAKAEFRNPPTFHVDLAQAAKFRVTLATVSSWGTPKLTITLDGKPTSLADTPVTANGAYEINVPAGPHDLFVDSTGTDWVQVASYSLTHYVGSLRCKALNGTDRVLGRVQSRAYTFSNPQTPKVEGGKLELKGLNHDGKWNLEWWDTDKGVKTGGTQVKVVQGAAEVSLPAITTDLAFKVFNAEEK